MVQLEVQSGRSKKQAPIMKLKVGFRTWTRWEVDEEGTKTEREGEKVEAFYTIQIFGSLLKIAI